MHKHVNSCLKGCNNTHAQAGHHPKHKSSFIASWTHHPCLLSQFLHILVPGIYSGCSCQEKMVKTKSCEMFLVNHNKETGLSFSQKVKRDLFLRILSFLWEKPELPNKIT